MKNSKCTWAAPRLKELYLPSFLKVGTEDKAEASKQLETLTETLEVVLQVAGKQ